MRICVLGVALVMGLVSASPRISYAQAAAPEVEVFGGLTKVWGHANGNKFDDGGGEASLTGYFNHVAGLEMDFDKYAFTVPTVPVFANHYMLLFGPHFAYHGNRWVSPFGHVLVGVTRGVTGGQFENTLVGRSAFTAAFGGGVDVKIWSILWVRPIQADYLHESFSSSPGLITNGVQNNLRLSAGLVLRFGSVGRR